MATLHDGDTFLLSGGPNPIYAEYLNTNGRLGWRIVDKYGKGILFEQSAMDRFSLLIQIALGQQAPGSLDEFLRNHGGMASG